MAGSFTGLLATVRRGKAQARLLAASTGDVDSSTLSLLRTAATAGPVRASVLAASVHSDLSTVSRQVAGLVAEGLLERRADESDGRACLLAVTDRGRAVAAEHEDAQAEFFARVLAGWDPDELDQFACLLDRFAGAFDQTHADWMRGWAARSLDGSRPPGGTAEIVAREIDNA